MGSHCNTPWGGGGVLPVVSYTPKRGAFFALPVNERAGKFVVSVF